jgi:hypothetical protein
MHARFVFTQDGHMRGMSVMVSMLHPPHFDRHRSSCTARTRKGIPTAEKKQYNPGPMETPGTGDQDQQRGAASGSGAGTRKPAGAGLSGGITDIDQRDGELDDSASGFSDEDLMRTNGGTVEKRDQR